jgi:hypothetical protein
LLRKLEAATDEELSKEAEG